MKMQKYFPIILWRNQRGISKYVREEGRRRKWRNSNLHTGYAMKSIPLCQSLRNRRYYIEAPRKSAALRCWREEKMEEKWSPSENRNHTIEEEINHHREEKSKRSEKKMKALYNRNRERRKSKARRNRKWRLRQPSMQSASIIESPTAKREEKMSATSKWKKKKSIIKWYTSKSRENQEENQSASISERKWPWKMAGPRKQSISKKPTPAEITTINDYISASSASASRALYRRPWKYTHTHTPIIERKKCYEMKKKRKKEINRRRRK